jgi:23S rRNA (cytosine1962-C5)-methyltransferase
MTTKVPLKPKLEKVQPFVTTLVLKKRFAQRFMKGHPFVYANELVEVPKLRTSFLARLQGPEGAFLAVGFFNPQSLVVFRQLTRDDVIQTPQQLDVWVEAQLAAAWVYRAREPQVSFRWVFGVSDSIPGLIVDSYWCLQPTEAYLVVIQAQTKGADAILEIVSKVVLAHFQRLGLPLCGIVIKNSATSRVKEGLAQQEAVIWEQLPWKPSLVQIRTTNQGVFWMDPMAGQKTGFFLDQVQNVQQVLDIIPRFVPGHRILDLCCYVGQWACGLAQKKSQVTLVDSSEAALAIAKKNAEVAGIKTRSFQMDVFEFLGQKTDVTGFFDVIVVDPPAFIKSQKDYNAGAKAYIKLFTAAVAKLSPFGVIVFCSCSGGVTKEAFSEWVWTACMGRNVRFTWGQTSFDHPYHPGFVESDYLKVLIGVFF